LHENAFGGRAPPGPAGEARPIAPPPRSASCYKGEGGNGKERVGNREQEEGKDVKGSTGIFVQGPQVPSYATACYSLCKTQLVANGMCNDSNFAILHDCYPQLSFPEFLEKKTISKKMC